MPLSVHDHADVRSRPPSGRCAITELRTLLDTAAVPAHTGEPMRSTVRGVAPSDRPRSEGPVEFLEYRRQAFGVLG